MALKQQQVLQHFLAQGAAARAGSFLYYDCSMGGAGAAGGPGAAAAAAALPGAGRGRTASSCTL